jgi:hypothetical protein
MEGRPFALIGVNSDKTLEKALTAVKKNELNWRSFQNEREGGKISDAWAVQGWPTIVVMDAKQRIVYRGHDGHEATKVATKLVEKLEKGEAEEPVAKLGTSVGFVAPDITGLDLNSVAFNLYDHKGKVIMLDFWGDW